MRHCFSDALNLQRLRHYTQAQFRTGLFLALPPRCFNCHLEFHVLQSQGKLRIHHATPTAAASSPARSSHLDFCDEEIMVIRTGIILFSGVLIGGCALHSPFAGLGVHSLSPGQTMLQSAADWHIVSARIGKELAQALKKGPNLPLYVDAGQATSFNQAIANQLSTSLVDDGYVVSKTAAGALKVEVDTQLLAFAPGRSSNTEIIVTISVSDEHRYYARYTAVYYVRDSERLLYGAAPPKDNAPLTKSFTVKGA